MMFGEATGYVPPAPFRCWNLRNHVEDNMNQEETATESGPKNRPVHEIRLGSVRAAIWRNETQKGSMFSVTISRSYSTKDASGKDVRRDSASFGRNDLLVASKALEEAHSWITTQK